jgi:hypothetical protein
MVRFPHGGAPESRRPAEALVLLQRALSIVLVLLGVALVLLLPWPWAEVPEVEAAKRTKFTCVHSFSEGNVHAFNPGTSPITIQSASYLETGQLSQPATRELAPGTAYRFGGLRVMQLTSASPFLVHPDSYDGAGTMVTGTCYRGK